MPKARLNVYAGMLAGLVLVSLMVSACSTQIQPFVPVESAQTLEQLTPIPDAQPTEQPSSDLQPSSAAGSSPSPTATATTLPTATPTLTPTPLPTAIPQTVQLTSGGCCTQPFWSAGSQQVRFIDRPGRNAPVGIWGVNISEPLTEPVLVSERLEDSLSELEDYRVETNGNTTFIERTEDGERWTVPANGENVSISPGRTRIAWSVSNENLPFEQRIVRIWVANLDGSDARRVARLPRGGLSGWISDDVLLVNGRETLQAQRQTLSALSLIDGTSTDLARSSRLRGVTLSPSRQWLVYYSTFDQDPDRNGLWLVRTDGSERRRLDSGYFGAYQWRGCTADCEPADDRLLVVPLRPDAKYHELWEIRADTGEILQLTDASTTPFKIANGDWRVSPDGRFITFVESADRNIWMIELP